MSNNNLRRLLNIRKQTRKIQSKALNTIRKRGKTLKLKMPPSNANIQSARNLAANLKNFTGGAGREPDCKLNPRDRINTGFYCRKNGMCYLTVRECDHAMILNGGRKRNTRSRRH
jgi:hypothetical protein